MCDLIAYEPDTNLCVRLNGESDGSWKFLPYFIGDGQEGVFRVCCADGLVALRNQYGNNDTSYWVPTLHCLGHIMRSTGFDKVDGEKLVGAPDSPPYCRGIVAAHRHAGDARFKEDA